MVSFWEYMSIQQHSDLKVHINQEHYLHWYSITNLDWGPYHAINYPNSPFHKIPNDESYRDKHGAIIPGDYVIRVSKGKGWWKNPVVDGSLQEIITDPLTQVGTICTYSMQGIVNLMNENTIIEELVDDGDLTRMLYCPAGSIPSGDIENENCEMPWMGVDYDGDDDVDGYDLLDYILNDMCETGTPDSDPWDDISFMTIESISDPGNPMTELEGEDMFNEFGVFTPPPMIIEEGLNRMLVILKGGKSRYVVFESDRTTQSDYSLSNFLDVNIYPVPLQGDEFKINLQASATLDFTYELFDFKGNLVHRTKYDIKQGHNEAHLVRTEKPIPRGLVLNRFSFSDGSSFSVTTTKE